MVDPNSPGWKAKQQDQRAARYAKLERKGRDAPAAHTSWGDKKRDAQAAARVWRGIDEATKK
jgi:hypothetical protein